MAMKKEDPAGSRSEEVQDIISRTPGGFVRYGTFALLVVILILFALAWFIHYPDVISAQVTINTAPAPVILVSRSSGELQLMRKEKEPATAGDLIAYIQTTASIGDVLAVEKTVDSQLASAELDGIDKLFAPETKYNLGDLQLSLTTFITCQRDWSVFKRNKLEAKQVAQLKQEIAIYQKLHANQQAKLNLMEHEFVLSREKFVTDSTLFAQHVISKIDFNQSKSTHLQQQRALRSTEAESINTQLQLAGLIKQVDEIEAGALTKESQFTTNCGEALKQLQADIDKWKENYLFLAPTGGTIAYLEYLEDNQFTESGKPLFSVIPTGGTIVAKAELPLTGSGKVKEGQRVNIMLDNYPFEQFGMLTGVVKTISLLPSNDRYTLILDLPSGMTTTHGNVLPFRQQLKGAVEVITEDMSVMDRIFYQFRKLIRQS